MERARVLERIADRIVCLDLPHPVRVAVDGLTGAGKTTLADELAPIVERRGRPVIRASIDDFYRPRAQRYQLGRLSPEGYYRLAFDYPAVRTVLLQPLGPGGHRRYRAAYFHGWHDAPIESPERQASSDAVLLVDGVFLLRPELHDLWDFRIFVDAAVDVAISRAT
jgi:uridine kinase